jgi:hypothetical protein
MDGWNNETMKAEIQRHESTPTYPSHDQAPAASGELDNGHVDWLATKKELDEIDLDAHAVSYVRLRRTSFHLYLEPQDLDSLQ